MKVSDILLTVTNPNCDTLNQTVEQKLHLYIKIYIVLLVHKKNIGMLICEQKSVITVEISIVGQNILQLYLNNSPK